MKLIKLHQDVDGNNARTIWVSPIHIVTVEPAAGDNNAGLNETLIRTTIGSGFALESVAEVVALLDAWRGDDKPPVRATRGKRNG